MSIQVPSFCTKQILDSPSPSAVLWEIPRPKDSDLFSWNSNSEPDRGFCQHLSILNPLQALLIQLRAELVSLDSATDFIFSGSQSGLVDHSTSIAPTHPIFRSASILSYSGIRSTLKQKRKYICIEDN